MIRKTGNKHPRSVHEAKPEAYEPPPGEDDFTSTEWALRWNVACVWATHAKALERLAQEPAKYEGLTFVLHHGHDLRPKARIICLDFDKCISEAGELDPEVANLIFAFEDTFIEFSRSGRGLHVFLLVEDCPAFSNLLKRKIGSCKVDVLCSNPVAVTGNAYGEFHELKTISFRQLEGLPFFTFKQPSNLSTVVPEWWSEDPVSDIPEEWEFLIGDMEAVPAIEGQGGSQVLFKAACNLMRYGVTGRVAEALLRMVPATPPFPAKQIMRTLECAYRATVDEESFDTRRYLDEFEVLVIEPSFLPQYNDALQTKLVESPPTPIIILPGFGEAVAAYYVESAYLKNERLGAAASLLLLSHFCGHRLAAFNGTTLNLALLLLCPSGMGKTTLSTFVSSIIDDNMGLGYVVGRAGSAEGLEDAFAATPHCLHVCEEFHGVIRAVSSQRRNANGGSNARLFDLYKEVHSACGKRLPRRRLTKNAGTRTLDDLYIFNPHVSFLLTAPKGPFWSAIDSEMLSDGTVGRLTLIECHQRGEPNAFAQPNEENYARISAFLRWIRSIEVTKKEWKLPIEKPQADTTQQPFSSVKATEKPINVGVTRDGQEYFAKLLKGYSDRAEHEYIQNDDDGANSVWARAGEMVARTASMVAISRIFDDEEWHVANIIVTVDDLLQGQKIVEGTIKRMLDGAATGRVDEKLAADQDAVMNQARKLADNEGFIDVNRVAASLRRRFKRHDFDRHLSDLCQPGGPLVVIEHGKKGSVKKVKLNN